MSATDAVDPSPSVSCNPASGSFFLIRTTTVKCTATDATGNASNGSFNVTVQVLAMFSAHWKIARATIS